MKNCCLRAATIVAVMFLGIFAHADSDTLLQAVGFALTGSDDAKVQPIDRSNCVFRIESEYAPSGVYHLNNVQVDRITLQSWKSNNGVFGERRYVTVDLHGSAPVYETTLPPRMTIQPNDTTFTKDLIKGSNLDTPKHIRSNEKTIELATSDQDRVKRAWVYIYAHGCVGQKSPF
jgi:hypothetical protein